MKLNNKRTILVGLAFMSISAFSQVYDGLIPKILKNTFDVGDTVSGVVMALDNVLALFMLPLFGALSDRTNTKIGRRMPYILAGTAGAAVLLILLPIADRIRSFWMFFIVLGLLLIAVATYRSPAVALMPDVTPKPLRSKGNAIINLMGAVGGIVMLGLIAVLVPKGDNPSYIPIFWVLAAFMILCILILFFSIKEPKEAEKMKAESEALGIDAEEQPKQEGKGVKMRPEVFRSLCFILGSIFLWFMGYNAVTTAFSKYAEHSWGMDGGDYALVLMVAQAAAIVAFIPVGVIASRIGRKKTILFGIVMLAVAFGCAMFFKNFSSLIFVFFSLAGFGWAFINVNSYPMVVEISSGADVGKYTGYYYIFSMAAQVVTPILSGAVLEFMGYHLLFPYGCLFVALSFVTMLFVKHGDSKPMRKKNRIESFDVDG